MAIPRICTVLDCGKKVYGHGYCSAHYQRWRRHGDPMAGGMPKGQGITQKFVHEVALPYQGDDCLIWPYGKGTPGYGIINYNGKNQAVHRLVCRLAHGEASSNVLQTRHKCGVRACVNPRHLEWGTPKENMQDKVRHGTAPRGANNAHTKLTEADVRWIRQFGANMPRNEVAQMFGVSPQTIGKVVLRRDWDWLE